DEIGRVLEADRKPYRAFGDAGAGEVGSAHAEVRCRRRMDDERLRVADVGEVREQAQRLDEPATLLARAAQIEAEDRTAAARKEPLRERVVRMLRELRISDSCHHRVT